MRMQQPQYTNRPNAYPMFAPRVWHGMSTSNWLDLFEAGDFDIQGRWGRASWVGPLGLLNSGLNRLQERLFGPRASQLPLVADPIFILGHWRTGTTYLHSLMAQDGDLWAPSNLECMTPGHFLVTRAIVSRMFPFPSRRPMDNMTISWNDPQEDEFALCIQGCPSVYQNIAFPHHEPTRFESLTLEDAPASGVRKWKRVLRRFVEYLNYAHERQLVLKSPPHTAKIPVLLEMFPNAKFVHITRDPQSFIPSTMHLWKTMHETNGLGPAAPRGALEEYVLRCFHHMYDSFDRSWSLIPQHNYCHITFDELIKSPLGALQLIYDRLDLVGYEKARPQFAQYALKKRGHLKNRFEPDVALAARVDEECQRYVERYGYEPARAA